MSVNRTQATKVVDDCLLKNSNNQASSSAHSTIQSDNEQTSIIRKPKQMIVNVKLMGNL